MKRFAILLVMLLPLAAWSQRSSMTVTLKGMNEGTKIVVNELQGNRMMPMDTVALDNKESLRMKYDDNEIHFMVLAPEGARSPLLHCMLLPKEKVTLTAEYDREKGYLHLVQVKGSENMEVYRQYNQAFYEMIQDENKRNTMPATIEKIVRENNNKLMSAFIVTYFESAFEQYAPLYKTVHDALIDRYPAHEFVKHLHEKLRNVVMVGMEAPDIALPDTGGYHTIRLSDLRGKVVLIDFWASWCSPCRRENPNVVRMYKKYHDKGFEIYSVSLDNDRDKWLAAIEKDGLIWPNHVSDLMGWNSAGGKLYGISSIPATVLVDRDGKVLARNLRGAELENKMKELFGE